VPSSSIEKRAGQACVSGPYPDEGKEIKIKGDSL